MTTQQLNFLLEHFDMYMHVWMNMGFQLYSLSIYNLWDIHLIVTKHILKLHSYYTLLTQQSHYRLIHNCRSTLHYLLRMVPSWSSKYKRRSLIYTYYKLLKILVNILNILWYAIDFLDTCSTQFSAINIVAGYNYY